MKHFLKKAFSGIGLAFLVLAISQPALASIPQAKATGDNGGGSAALNADPQDFVVLAVSNYTRNPNCSTCWGPSVSNVQPGEIIAFRIYAHNTGSQPAYNTRIRMNISGAGTSQRAVRGTLSADNAPAVWDDANVALASGVTSLSFVGGEYYADSSLDPSHPDAFPAGTSASQIPNGGINIGTLQNDYAGHFTKDVQIVVRFKAEGNGGGTNTCDRVAPTLTVTPSSDVIDVDDVARFRAIYDSNGPCAGGESDVTNAATWASDDSRIASNEDDGRFRGEREGNTTIRARYSGLTDTASLRVRDNNNNDDDDDDCDDETLVIVPYQASFGVGQTYQYRALYDSDGPGCRGSERDVTASASWSGDSGIVENLDDGRYRGRNAGTATITARYSGVTATARANVFGGGTIIQEPPVIQQPPIVLPPTVIGGGTIVRGGAVGTVTSGVTDESVACITVTPSVDVTSMLPGQDFVYTTLYRNDCPFALNNAVLRVFIPNDVEFKASSNPFFIREGQKFSYNIGTLPPGGQGSVAVSGLVRKDARIGDTETFTSTIEFMSSKGRIEGTTSYLVAVLGGDIRRTLSANLADTLGHIFGSAWLWILVTLLILAGIIWFIVAMIMRRRSGASSTTKVTTVTPAEDPLRALRNA